MQFIVIKEHESLLKSYRNNVVHSRVEESLTLTSHGGKLVLGEIVFWDSYFCNYCFVCVCAWGFWMVCSVWSDFIFLHSYQHYKVIQNITFFTCSVSTNQLWWWVDRGHVWYQHKSSFTHTHAHTHTHTHTHTHARTHTRARTHAHTHTHARTHTHTRTRTHAHTHTHITCTAVRLPWLPVHSPLCGWVSRSLFADWRDPTELPAHVGERAGRLYVWTNSHGQSHPSPPQGLVRWKLINTSRMAAQRQSDCVGLTNRTISINRDTVSCSLRHLLDEMMKYYLHLKQLFPIL